MKEYRFIDKSRWPRGEWDNEPDKVQWIDEATDLECLAVRHRSSGHWCGYVGVPPGHPLFQVNDSEVQINGEWPDVHGGLTFSGLCEEGAGETGICHVPEAGRPDKVWWLGFDCAHLGDVSPVYLRDNRDLSDSYRDLIYVKMNCRNLAAWISGAKPTENKQ